jgi:hypothetical protein
MGPVVGVERPRRSGIVVGRRDGTSGPTAWRGPARVGLGLMLGAFVMVGCLLIAGAGHATAPARARTAATTVLSIYQSPGRVVEQSRFTVYMELASTANIKQVYFTFCQLSSALCYLPVTMTPAGGNWFAGTTNPMTSYHGMVVGVRAGYNITIEYNDNSTFYEPALPNAFSNLTIATSITGEYMFQMTVSDHVYNLSGQVTDRASGAPLAGATVALTPGNYSPTTTDAAGGYTFVGVANGSYTLSVSKGGYAVAQSAVTVAGQPVSQNLALTGNQTPVVVTPKGSSPSFFATPTGYAAIAAIGVAVVAPWVVIAARRRARRASAEPSKGADPPPRPPEK